MSDEKFRCPRRSEDPFGPYATEQAASDNWAFRQGGQNRTCSYCGSVHPDDFLRRLEFGAEVGPTDKDYKAYITDHTGAYEKMYFQHFGLEHAQLFVDMINTKSMRVAYPGYFYTLPFFCERTKK